MVTFSGKRELSFFIITALTAVAAVGAIFALYAFVFTKNVRIYTEDSYNHESLLIGKQRITRRSPFIDMTRVSHYPAEECTIVIKKHTAKRLYGRFVIIRLRESTHSHLVEQCHGDYWITISTVNDEKKNEE